ncbi:MAG: hypothetical protein QCI00_02820 [Candidatus Thermoplasmatota archaeon]|nr:hypothetical protein [Candidatus Thermoplasmatota archaeon]
MKTIMIVDDVTVFTEKIRESCKNQDVRILTAATNRDALEQLSDENKVDLLLIPTISLQNEKGYLPCRSTDSFNRLADSFDHLLTEHSSSDEIKNFIMNTLCLSSNEE